MKGKQTSLSLNAIENSTTGSGAFIKAFLCHPDDPISKKSQDMISNLNRSHRKVVMSDNKESIGMKIVKTFSLCRRFCLSSPGSACLLVNSSTHVFSSLLSCRIGHWIITLSCLLNISSTSEPPTAPCPPLFLEGPAGTLSGDRVLVIKINGNTFLPCTLPYHMKSSCQPYLRMLP